MKKAFTLILAVALPLAFVGAGRMLEEGSAPAGADGALDVSAEKLETEVAVRVGDAVFTRYKFADAQKYPYFWPVNGPRSGESVTTESSEPYPHHHSLFFGCDHVNGGNYWQQGLERGRIDSREVRVVGSGGKKVSIEDRCVWVRPGAPDVLEDRRTWTISAPGADVRLIDLEITLTALVDIHVSKTNHSLFSARVVEELSPKGAGRLVNSRGQSGEKETFGQAAEWCGFHGERGGIVEGLAILVHPRNPWGLCPWFTRDYGFISPTPMYWLGPEGWKLEKGKSVTLRYRVVVHAGSPSEAGLERIWKEWTKD